MLSIASSVPYVMQAAANEQNRQVFINATETIRLIFTIINAFVEWHCNTDFGSKQEGKKDRVEKNRSEVDQQASKFERFMNEQNEDGSFAISEEERKELWGEMFRARQKWESACGAYKLPAHFARLTDQVPNYVKQRLDDFYTQTKKEDRLSMDNLQDAISHMSPHKISVNFKQLQRDNAIVSEQLALDETLALDEMRENIKQVQVTEQQYKEDLNNRIVRDTEAVQKLGRSRASRTRSRNSSKFQSSSNVDDSYEFFIGTLRTMTNVAGREAVENFQVQKQMVNFNLEEGRKKLLDTEQTTGFAAAVNNMLDGLTNEEAVMQVLAMVMAYFHPGSKAIIKINILHDLHHKDIRGVYASTYQVVFHPLRDGALYILKACEKYRSDILLFRGTSPRHMTGGISDLLPNIGEEYFDEAYTYVRSFIDDRYKEDCSANRQLCIVGHSLGGAVAYRCMAALTEKEQQRTSVLVFSPPGIDRKKAENVIQSPHIRIFWHEDDIVPLSGETHLPGKVYEFVVPLVNKMPGSHVEPVLAQHVWGAYKNKTPEAEIRIRSTARDGTANNPHLNLADYVRASFGHWTMKLIQSLGQAAQGR